MLQVAFKDFPPFHFLFCHLLTGHQVEKRPVAECGDHLDCLSCLSARDPYCGWCVLQGRSVKKSPLLHYILVCHYVFTLSASDVDSAQSARRDMCRVSGFGVSTRHNNVFVSTISVSIISVVGKKAMYVMEHGCMYLLSTHHFDFSLPFSPRL